MSTLKVDGIRSNSASSDAITLASDGTCTANITNRSNRNKIINGAMTVHQRSSSVTGITSNGYQTADRMLLNVSTGTFTNTISTDTPDGFGSSFKIDCTTADTSLSAGDNVLFKQRIEGQNLQDFAKGTSAAKQFAVSFYVKTNKSGVYTVELSDIDNSRIATKTFTVSDSNWNRYTLIFPADTTGAFDNDNAVSLDLIIWLAAGTTFTSGTLNTSSWASKTNANRVSSSNVNIADSTSNEWYLTGVQLEVGSVATDFEHRSYGDELLKCQRYFCKAAEKGGSDHSAGMGTNYSSSVGYIHVRFPVTMRTNPTLDQITGTSYYRIFSNGSYETFDSFNSLDTATVTPQCAEVLKSGISITQGSANFVRYQHSEAEIRFSAEL